MDTLRIDQLAIGSIRPRLSALPEDVLRLVRGHLDGRVLDEVAFSQSCSTVRAIYHPPAPPALPVEGSTDAHEPTPDRTSVPEVGDRASITTDEGLSEEKRWQTLLAAYGLGRPRSRFVGQRKAMRAIDLSALSWRQMACGLAHHARHCKVAVCRTVLEHQHGRACAPFGRRG